MTTILVCGDRNWTNIQRVREIFQLLQRTYTNITIVTGECRGADLIAKNLCMDFGFTYRGFPADWNTHGKSAGPIRNREMLSTNPFLVIAFHNNIQSSRGTKDMLSAASNRYRYIVTDTTITSL